MKVEEFCIKVLELHQEINTDNELLTFRIKEITIDIKLLYQINARRPRYKHHQ